MAWEKIWRQLYWGKKQSESAKIDVPWGIEKARCIKQGRWHTIGRLKKLRT